MRASNPVRGYESQTHGNYAENNSGQSTFGKDIPLPGVNVIIKGTTTGTVTDIHGNYQLVSNADAPTLVYSFIGLKTEEVKVNNQRELIVKLQSDVAQLSEVVITGYTFRK
ncbi:MAG: carboxypeptidase-like regulatory domain-containing protein [Flammeovirgaceae bacterium]|nr:carboxypeptidase-like regulatory domain-containing protein [Flammeovirgaceae bacterium]